MRNAVILIAALLGLLCLAMIFAYSGLVPHEGTPALGVHGWTAMILGTVFSIIVGGGLMALLFYSSRHGYDEPPKIDDQRERESLSNRRASEVPELSGLLKS